MFLSKVPESIQSPVMTALFERLLKLVEKGEYSLEDFLQTQVKYITKEIDKVKSTM